MGARLQLRNKIFGRWTVMEEAEERDKHGFVQWLCKCECGNISKVSGNSLKHNRSLSCGCLQKEMVKKNAIHGYGGKREDSYGYVNSEYSIWQCMKQRCTNPKTHHYNDYGGRGIKVCDRWLNSFENFLTDMGPRPSIEYSLDRWPDNNGDYGPGNCRWATRKQQAEGRRNNIIVEYRGEKKILSQWAVILGVNHNVLLYHVRKNRPFNEIYEHFIKRTNKCPA